MQKDVIVRTKNALQVLREKRLLSMVQPHPLIVGLVSSMQDQNCLYLLQEFINGGDLFHRLCVLSYWCFHSPPGSMQYMPRCDGGCSSSSSSSSSSACWQQLRSGSEEESGTRSQPPRMDGFQ